MCEFLIRQINNMRRRCRRRRVYHVSVSFFRVHYHTLDTYIPISHTHEVIIFLTGVKRN